MLKRTTKPLRRRVLIEEGTAESSKKQHSENTDKWHLCHVKQVVFPTVNHRGPLPLRELHSTSETIVWRDPGGSWACLPPVYSWVWNHPATGCDMCTTPEKHTKKRETPRKANQKKTTRRAGYKKGYAPPPPSHPSPRKHSEFKKSDEMLNKTRTLTKIARQKKAKEKALKWTSQTGKQPYKNHSEKNRALQNAKKNNKTTKKKSFHRRRHS